MSRIDDLKKQNKELDISLIDLLSSADPSNTNKYLGFLIKLLKGDGFETLTPTEVKKFILHRIFGDELNLLKRFEDHCSAQRIKNPDISKLKSFTEIYDLVIEADNVIKQRELEKQVIKIYDKDDYLILIPLSYPATVSYGSNTRWCITQKDTWEDYWGSYRIIIIIDKLNRTKYAVSLEIDDKLNIQGWNANDDEINPILLPLPEHILSILINELKKNKFETEVQYLGDDKILTSENGVVDIENATEIELMYYLKIYEDNIPKKQEEILKKKIENLGGTFSEEKNKKIEISKDNVSDINKIFNSVFNTKLNPQSDFNENGMWDFLKKQL